jgi:hypothetical protein
VVSNQVAPTLVKAYITETAAKDPTRAPNGNIRNVTLVYGNCTSYPNEEPNEFTTASITLLHEAVDLPIRGRL